MEKEDWRSECPRVEVSQTLHQLQSYCSIPPVAWAVLTSFMAEKVKVKSLSHVRLFATLWIVAHKAPPSMGFSKQEYWSGLPHPSPGDLSNPGIEPRSPSLQADALTSEPPGRPTPLGHHKASSWAPYAIQQLSTSWLFYTWWCIRVNSTLPIHPLLFFPHSVYKIIFYVCICVPALQIGS